MTATAADLARLHAELEARFGSAILPRGTSAPEVEGFRIGQPVLDRLLPMGVPRGALSLWTGEMTSGRTGVLRRLVRSVCAEGARVALVDASRTLDPAAWCGPAGAIPGLWVARPPEPRVEEGAWAAEALLRSGAFDLVVVDGALPLPAQSHRLRALAREGEVALLLSAEAPPPGCRADVQLAFSRHESRDHGLAPGGRFRRRMRVRLEKGFTAGGEREVEVVHEPQDRMPTGAPESDRRAGRR